MRARFSRSWEDALSLPVSLPVSLPRDDCLTPVTQHVMSSRPMLHITSSTSVRPAFESARPRHLANSNTLLASELARPRQEANSSIFLTASQSTRPRHEATSGITLTVSQSTRPRQEANSSIFLTASQSTRPRHEATSGITLTVSQSTRPCQKANSNIVLTSSGSVRPHHGANSSIDLPVSPSAWPRQEAKLNIALTSFESVRPRRQEVKVKPCGTGITSNDDGIFNIMQNLVCPEKTCLLDSKVSSLCNTTTQVSRGLNSVLAPICSSKSQSGEKVVSQDCTSVRGNSSRGSKVGMPKSKGMRGVDMNLSVRQQQQYQHQSIASEADASALSPRKKSLHSLISRSSCPLTMSSSSVMISHEQTALQKGRHQIDVTSGVKYQQVAASEQQLKQYCSILTVPSSDRKIIGSKYSTASQFVKVQSSPTASSFCSKTFHLKDLPVSQYNYVSAVPSTESVLSTSNHLPVSVLCSSTEPFAHHPLVCESPQTKVLCNTLVAASMYPQHSTNSQISLLSGIQSHKLSDVEYYSGASSNVNLRGGITPQQAIQDSSDRSVLEKESLSYPAQWQGSPPSVPLRIQPKDLLSRVKLVPTSGAQESLVSVATATTLAHGKQQQTSSSSRNLFNDANEIMSVSQSRNRKLLATKFSHAALQSQLQSPSSSATINREKKSSRKRPAHSEDQVQANSQKRPVPSKDQLQALDQKQPVPSEYQVQGCGQKRPVPSKDQLQALDQKQPVPSEYQVQGCGQKRPVPSKDQLQALDQKQPVPSEYQVQGCGQKRPVPAKDRLHKFSGKRPVLSEDQVKTLSRKQLGQSEDRMKSHIGKLSVPSKNQVPALSGKQSLQSEDHVKSSSEKLPTPYEDQVRALSPMHSLKRPVPYKQAAFSRKRPSENQMDVCMLKKALLSDEAIQAEICSQTSFTDDGNVCKKYNRKPRFDKHVLQGQHTLHSQTKFEELGRSNGHSTSKRSNKQFLKKLLVQRLRCSDRAMRSVMPCLECKKLRTQQASRVKKHVDHQQCRFFAFRRLRVGKNKKLQCCGFLAPRDCQASDVALWMPPIVPPTDPELDVESALYIIQNVGSGFCDLMEQEKAAMSWVKGGDTLAWKKAVEGVREMCDACSTTMFNMHWTCAKCGHAICLDCYRSVMECMCAQQASEDDNETSTACKSCVRILVRCGVTRCLHTWDLLMPTQIIPSDAMCAVGRAIHQVRTKWHIKDGCPCGESLAQESVDSIPITSVPIAGEKDVVDAFGSNPNGDRGMCSSCSTVGVRACCTELAEDSKMEPKNFDSRTRLIEVITNKKTKHCVSEASFPLKNLKQMAGTEGSIPRNIAVSDVEVDAPHTYLDDGRLLQLLDPGALGNLSLFRQEWSQSHPVLVSNCDKRLTTSLWRPESFSAEFGDRVNDLVDCARNVVLVGYEMKHFWDGFECVGKRLHDAKSGEMILKLKDWPPTDDFADILPSRFTDLLGALPLPEYTGRKGVFNLASRLPQFFVRPDLGPKMYNAYGSALSPKTGSTNLHLDISDAINVLLYVGIPHDDFQRHTDAAMEAIMEAGCCNLSKNRINGDLKPGALWHIFDPHDSNKIRDLLRKVGLEQNQPVEPNHDPIHDQSWYLDEYLRGRLWDEYRVRGYTILQCLGDAIFIPAGAPHQVRNLHSCIKAAEDFVSPENLHYCFKLTQEFRDLSDTHSNHEDKLQVKNIIYHTVKDSVSVLLAENSTVASLPVK